MPQRLVELQRQAGQAAVAVLELSRPHIAVVVQAGDCEAMQPPRATAQEDHGIAQALLAYLHREMRSRFPGALLLEHDQCLVALLPTPPEDAGAVEQSLQAILRQVELRHNVPLSAGIASLCRSEIGQCKGIAKAEEALRIGQCAWGAGRISRYADLGIYRHLYRLAQMSNSSDPWQAKIYRLVEYDRRRETVLLSTLETYLDCQCNLSRTARLLYVHRNTLLQRLNRIAEVTGIDLKKVQDWLALQLALKIIKLRALAAVSRPDCAALIDGMTDGIR